MCAFKLTLRKFRMSAFSKYFFKCKIIGQRLIEIKKPINTHGEVMENNFANAVGTLL